MVTVGKNSEEDQNMVNLNKIVITVTRGDR